MSVASPIKPISQPLCMDLNNNPLIFEPNVLNSFHVKNPSLLNLFDHSQTSSPFRSYHHSNDDDIHGNINLSKRPKLNCMASDSEERSEKFETKETIAIDLNTDAETNKEDSSSISTKKIEISTGEDEQNDLDLSLHL